MKDHEKRELVNDLTAIAAEFCGAQQLRERIAHCVLPALDAVAAAEREACAKVCEAEERRIDALGDKIIADEGDNSLYLAGKGVAAGKCARLIRARSNASVSGAEPQA